MLLDRQWTRLQDGGADSEKSVGFGKERARKRWLLLAGVGGAVASALLGCQGERAEEVPEVELVPEAEVPVPPAPEVEAPAPAAPEPEVLFSEDFESGDVGRWTSVTIVEGGAGGSKYAVQGTVEEGANPEYWGLALAVDGELTLSLDIFFDAPPVELQIITFAQTAANPFRLPRADLSPGRWHHVEVQLAGLCSWDGGSLVGDTIQNINIWVQGPAGSTFRFDNVKVYR